jgi:hypothetical protein
MPLYGNTLKIAMHKHYKHNNNAMLQYGMEDQSTGLRQHIHAARPATPSRSKLAHV